MKNGTNKESADELIRVMRDAWETAVAHSQKADDDYWWAVAAMVVSTPDLCDLLEKYSTENETLRAGLARQSRDVASLKRKVDQLWELANETERGCDG